MIVTIRLILVPQGSNYFVINTPFDPLFGPVKHIFMERALRVVDGFLCTSVVVASLAFAEVVGLCETFVLVEVVAGELPVELILVVTHENAACDQPVSRCSLKLDFYATEHKVVLRPDVGSIISFSEGEIGAHVAVEGYICIICKDPVAW